MTKLVNFIRRELDRQDLADHEIDFIKSDEDGNMVHDLSLTPSASRIERALNAIVNNRIIRQKVNGEPLVQIAGTMMEWTNPTEADLAEYRDDATNDLKSYMIGPDGKTLGMEVKVALQGNFESLIHLRHKDGKKIAVYTKDKEEKANGEVRFVKNIDEAATLLRLNETIRDEAWRKEKANQELLMMTGVRIPVQGHNSMEFMMVKEFLPKAAGNIIIPPSEIVAKSGSDFDIDKLTIMMPTISLIGGVPEVIKETRLSSVAEKFKRSDEIKAELKELRKARAEASKAYEKAYDKLKTDGMTAEETLEVKQMRETYHAKRDELNKEYNTALYNEERLETYETLTDNQVKLLRESKEVIKNTESAKEVLAEEYREASSEFGTEVRKKNIEALNNSDVAKLKKELSDKYNTLLREQKGLSGEAIENTMLESLKGILELPHNFVNLITPNDTNLLQGEGSITEDLAQYRDYKSTNGVQGDTGVMSATRVLEPAYNAYKHESNAVGKDTLGLGAVDNTYNTVLTRIGAYLNPTYVENNKMRRAEILMDHNKLTILEGSHKGKKGISLSHLYDVNNENKVADVINQLLNGWLDVAKDAWIFDIQGNKQVTPILMFLLQAGVPLKKAIYFVSNPLVKEYVKQQKITTSAFARFLGVQPEQDPTYFRSHAKDIVLSDINLAGLKGKTLYDETIRQTDGVDFTDLVEDIAHKSYADAKIDGAAKAAFLHYLELEKTSEGVRDIKMKLNYDTAQSTDLFDAQRKEADLRQLYADSKIPNQMINSILNDSTIGGFRIADFQLSLWGPLFKIRTKLSPFLIEKLAVDSSKMKKIYANEERYVEEFKNDFIMRMFSTAIKDFDVNSDTYKGLTIKRNVPVTKAEHSDRGVIVKPNAKGEMMMYISEDVLKRQFDNKLYVLSGQSAVGIDKVANKKFNYRTLGLAPVEEVAFLYGGKSKRSEYYRFVVEREFLRATNPFSEMSKTRHFEYRYKANLKKAGKLANETKEQHEERVLKSTYEEMLRDYALNNILNYWKLFMSKDSMAHQLVEMKEMNPTLEKDYNVVNDLVLSEGKTQAKSKLKGARNRADSYTNISLRDNRVDKDMLNIYHNNLVTLADPSTRNIIISRKNTEQDKAENQRISEFFSKLPLFAFLQSGLNTIDNLSITRIIPTSQIVELIEPVMDGYIKELNKPDNNLLHNFYNQFNSVNHMRNVSIRKRLKNFVRPEGKQAISYNLTDTAMKADHSIPMNFKDGDGGRTMRSEFKGKSTFDLIMSGDRTATSRSPESKAGVKQGDIVEFTKKYGDYVRKMIVRATSDEYPVSNVTSKEWSKLEGWNEARHEELVKKDYVQFTFELIDMEELKPKSINKEGTNFIEVGPANKNELETLIKNNPNVIFVLEGSTNPEHQGSYVEGIGKIGVFDNVVNINLRDALTNNDNALWNRLDNEENKAIIDDSIKRLEDVFNKTDKHIAMLSPMIGYGSYLTEYDPARGSMVSSDAYRHLSAELYGKFKYANKNSNVITDVQGLMKENQKIEDFQLEIPITDLIEARERLTCK